jgi:DNA polymerase-3 subunit alpha
MTFVHLHNHSQYSLLDGLNSPTELVAAAKDFGQPGISITDHGTLSGHRELQRAAKAAGLKPVLGIEAYISPTDRFDKRSVKKRDDDTSLYNHIILLAKNQTGVRNIHKLSETAWTEGYYYKPRIDAELLSEHRDGIIVLSGCLNGLIAKAIEREDMDEAHRLTKWFKDEFDQDFYIEVQAHNPATTNGPLLELADYYGVRPVATSDCHYAKEEDGWIEEALLILSTNPKANPEADLAYSKTIKDIYERFNYLYPDRKMSFQNFNLYIQSRTSISDDFAKQGVTRTDIFDNTIHVLDSIGDYEYKENLAVLPKPKKDAAAELRRLCIEGLKRLGLDNNAKYLKRLEIELDIISKKDFSSYFLIVADMVNWTKGEGILVGPGRGSSAGSLVCYALDITTVDPIKRGLLFARFINEERNDFPDIDVDIEGRRRNEVKDYMVKKYKNVASVSTYSYFADKGVIRDAARVYGIDISEVNKALKPVGSFEEFETSINTRSFREKHPEVLDLAKHLRGRIRGAGMHAGGLVVANKPINLYAPIETRSSTSDDGTRIPVVAADKKEIALIGLIKIDALGVNTLSVIADALSLIKTHKNVDVKLLDLTLDDPAVFRMISAGFTKGVFQAEANPSTNLLVKMGCENFDTLVASNALVRPGAMNTVGASYVARKQGREQVKTPHPILDEITKETFGVIIYQEQVMLACTELAGFSWSEADEIRSIIGKKEDPHKFDAFKQRWLDGASKNISMEDAEQLWHDFEAHAGYSFNKSHADAYSTVSYWTAWLKYYYPQEFMTALLINENESAKVTSYLIEAKRLGIRVLLPHVNMSGMTYQMEGDAIRIGLSNIKYMSDKTVPSLMRHRPYDSYAALMEVAGTKGSGVTKRLIDALDAIGGAVFDDNPLTGNETSNFYEYLNIPKFDTSKIPLPVMLNVRTADEYEEEGTFAILAMIQNVKKGKGWALLDFVDETGQASVFTSDKADIEKGQMYLMLVSDNRVNAWIAAHEVPEMLDNPFVKYLNEGAVLKQGRKYVVDFTPYKTKAGKQMAYVVLGDEDGGMEKVMVFEDLYRKSLGAMQAGKTPKLSLARLKSGALFVKDIIDDRIANRPAN